MEHPGIVVLGAGGFGREVHDVILAADLTFVGFIDDRPDLALLERRGAHHLGGLDDLSGFAGMGFVVGVGDPVTRRRLSDAAVAAGLRPHNVIHPRSVFGEENRLGVGLVVCSHVSVTTNVTIGHHVHLNLNATVGHDVVLGDYVTVNPGANISGNVILEDGVTIGTGAAVIQGVRIGANTVVGAGAVVTRDLPSGVTAVGAPAKPR